MLETIFNSIGGSVVNTIAEKAGVTVDQAKEILPLAQETVQSGFMEQVTSGNVAGITSLFNSNETDMESNSIFSGIKNTLVSSIMDKMGLPESVAGIAASSCIGNVMNEISGFTKDDTGTVTETGLLEKLGLGGTVLTNFSALTGDKTEAIANTETVAETVAESEAVANMETLVETTVETEAVVENETACSMKTETEAACTMKTDTETVETEAVANTETVAETVVANTETAAETVIGKVAETVTGVKENLGSVGDVTENLADAVKGKIGKITGGIF